jgi:uncharacterized membrane protein
MSWFTSVPKAAENVTGAVKQAVAHWLPDPVEQEKAAGAIVAAVLPTVQEIAKAQSSVIVAEAQGQSWLQRNWRPGLMVIFAVIILSAWLGYVPRNLPQGFLDHLWGLLETGIGGYVIGRSVEQTARAVVSGIRK